jgi:secreted PhoX family phosphatase
MHRRRFLAATAATAVLGPSLWRTAIAAPVAGDGPYGPLGEPDANGVRLPAGFRSRVIARAGVPVGLTGYVWHPAPDGGATFATDDGGWVYVSNSEVPFAGGVGAVRFDAGGEIVGAHRILSGTSMNCAGGPTPWGTWLSGEEHDWGEIWECDPHGLGQGTALPALGTFSHEAAAVDPKRGHVYLTEDQPDGLLYRFTPDTPGDLTSGVLEAAAVDGAPDGPVRWLPVPNPNPVHPMTATRHQVEGATGFRGGEGCWHHKGTVYVTTKGDNRVWAYDCATSTIAVVYDDDLVEGTPLRGVDNVTVARNGDVFVAEDGDDMQICIISNGGDGAVTVAPVLEVPGHLHSEITGPAFDPSGTRLYFSSQRGPAPGGPGITYEVSGPFRGAGRKPRF